MSLASAQQVVAALGYAVMPTRPWAGVLPDCRLCYRQLYSGEMSWSYPIPSERNTLFCLDCIPQYPVAPLNTAPEQCYDCGGPFHDGRTCCAAGTCRHPSCASVRVQLKRSAARAESAPPPGGEAEGSAEAPNAPPAPSGSPGPRPAGAPRKVADP